MRLCTYVIVRMYVRTYVQTHTYVRTYIHTYIRTRLRVNQSLQHVGMSHKINRNVEQLCREFFWVTDSSSLVVVFHCKVACVQRYFLGKYPVCVFIVYRTSIMTSIQRATLFFKANAIRMITNVRPRHL